MSSMAITSVRRRLARRTSCRSTSDVRDLIAAGLSVSSGAVPSFTPSR